MKYLVITNKGELELGALTLLGASTKREDQSKVGFFGSGFKYALATLIRLGSMPTIFAGESELKLGTAAERFRDKSFSVITVNGRKSSITTEAGPAWGAWEAIRDIWANAQDEGSATREVRQDKPRGTSGSTSIWIPVNPLVQEVLNAWDKYFIGSRKRLGGNPQIDLLSKHVAVQQPWIGNGGFLAIGEEQGSNTSLFDYQIKGRVLNESRRLDNMYSVYGRITTLWLNCDKPDLIYSLLKDLDESHLEWFVFDNFIYGGTSVNPAWKAVLQKFPVMGEKVFDVLKPENRKGFKRIPDKLYDTLMDSLGLVPALLRIKGTIVLTTRELTDSESERVVNLWAKLERTFHGIGRFKTQYITYSREDGEAIKGLADVQKSRMYLTADAFRCTDEDLASTLIEEWAHLEFGYGDYTPSFQDWLVRQLGQLALRAGEQPEEVLPEFDLDDSYTTYNKPDDSGVLQPFDEEVPF